MRKVVQSCSHAVIGDSIGNDCTPIGVVLRSLPALVVLSLIPEEVVLALTSMCCHFCRTNDRKSVANF